MTNNTTPYSIRTWDDGEIDGCTLYELTINGTTYRAINTNGGTIASDAPYGFDDELIHLVEGIDFRSADEFNALADEIIEATIYDPLPCEMGEGNTGCDCYLRDFLTACILQEWESNEPIPYLRAECIRRALSVRSKQEANELREWLNQLYDDLKLGFYPSEIEEFIPPEYAE